MREHTTGRAGVREVEPVQMHDDLTTLARLSCVLTRGRAVRGGAKRPQTHLNEEARSSRRVREERIARCQQFELPARPSQDSIPH